MDDANREPGRTVRVIVTPGHVAVMDQAVPAAEAALVYGLRVFRVGGRRGVREVVERRRAHDLDHRGRLAFPAGLLSRVRTALASAGYAVELEDQRLGDPRMVADPEVLAGLDAGDETLVRAVAAHPQGRVVVASPAAALAGCRLLARAFPRAKFVVGVPTRKAALGVWGALSAGLADERVGLVTGGVRRRGKRVVVGTFASLAPETVPDPHVLLLPAAEGATGEWAAAAAIRTRVARVYAWVRHGVHPDWYTQWRLEELAGEVIAGAPPAVGGRAVMLRSPDCGVPQAVVTELDRKRAWYWNNQIRNWAIAAVARGILNNDEAQLRRVGLRPGPRVPSVTVVVESAEHGRALEPRLAGWPLLTLTSAQGLPPDGGGVIVTEAYAATRGVESDVLIRATGTPWPLRVAGFPAAAGTDSERLVIDFTDGFCTAAEEMARRRAEGYRRAGMGVTVERPG